MPPRAPRRHACSRRSPSRAALRVRAGAAVRDATPDGSMSAVLFRAGDFFGSGKGSWLDLVIAKDLQDGKTHVSRRAGRADGPGLFARPRTHLRRGRRRNSPTIANPARLRDACTLPAPRAPATDWVEAHRAPSHGNKGWLARRARELRTKFAVVAPDAAWGRALRADAGRRPRDALSLAHAARAGRTESSRRGSAKSRIPRFAHAVRFVPRPSWAC